MSEEHVFALTSLPLWDVIPSYSLADVASGRYVQDFFLYLLRQRDSANLSA